MVPSPPLQALPVKDLPGVGWSTEQKLEGKGITTVAHVLVRVLRCARWAVPWHGWWMMHLQRAMWWVALAFLPASLPRGQEEPGNSQNASLAPADAQARSREFLQAELGPKLGAQLWDYAHGRDDR